MPKVDERPDDDEARASEPAPTSDGETSTEPTTEASDDVAKADGDARHDDARPAPRKTKPKPKRADEDDDDAPGGPRARLSFARDFPPSVALDELLAAFDRGDYGRVRELAPRLVKDENADVARAARDVARRIEPDRAVLSMLGISIALLAVLAIWFWTHRLGAHP